MWKQEFSQDLLNTINSPCSKGKINTFLETPFEQTEANVNTATEYLSNIIVEAALKVVPKSCESNKRWKKV